MRFSIVVTDYNTGQFCDAFIVDGVAINDAYDACHQYLKDINGDDAPPGESESYTEDSVSQYMLEANVNRMWTITGIYWWEESMTFYITGQVYESPPS